MERFVLESTSMSLLHGIAYVVLTHCCKLVNVYSNCSDTLLLQVTVMLME